MEKDEAASSNQMTINVRILGDGRPFSRYGQSISYLVEMGKTRFLIDSGAPIFEQLSREEIDQIEALFSTHSHEDHKRWFTDLALFRRYVSDRNEKLRMVTSHRIHREYERSSQAALGKTLTPDSKQVEYVPYETFVEPYTITPEPRFRIVRTKTGPRTYQYQVKNQEGNDVPPSRAKIVINKQGPGTIPHLITRDPDTGYWVKPDLYYPFEKNYFYPEPGHPYTLEHDGGTPATITAFKAPVWHGPPTIGFEITTEEDRVLFGSDTVYDPELWETLEKETRSLQLESMDRDEFQNSRVIRGNVNQFIEKTWSRERLEKALTLFRDAAVIHDCGPEKNPVHTKYREVHSLNCKTLVLTHTPDQFVSEYPLACRGKNLVFRNNEVLEQASDGTIYPFDADIYARESNRSYVGFKNEKGPFRVVRNREGVLDIVPDSNVSEGEELFGIDLFRDINGLYFPYLRDDDKQYRVRSDGQVEKVIQTDEGSKGTVVTSLRTPGGGVSDTHHS